MVELWLNDAMFVSPSPKTMDLRAQRVLMNVRVSMRPNFMGGLTWCKWGPPRYQQFQWRRLSKFPMNSCEVYHSMYIQYYTSSLHVQYIDIYIYIYVIDIYTHICDIYIYMGARCTFLAPPPPPPTPMVWSPTIPRPVPHRTSSNSSSTSTSTTYY